MGLDLSSIPVFDGHAHNLLLPAWLKEYPIEGIFTESTDREYLKSFAVETLAFKRSLKDIAAVLECDPSIEAIRNRREKMEQAELADLYFKRANISGVVLDDGFWFHRTWPLEWHSSFVNTYRALRIESLAEALFENSISFDSFLSDFRDALLNPPGSVVAYKSIIAYRSGLRIGAHDKRAARDGYLVEKERNTGRLTDRRLLGFLFKLTLEVCRGRDLPLQIHTGWGDSDLDLRESNPLHLKPLLDEDKYSRTRLVLLHCYPYTREAAYLAAIYPEVYIDFGLSVPLLSVAGMEAVIGEMLEIAPVTKICYSSDARFMPEGFYLAATWARRAVGLSLERSIQCGELTLNEALKAAARILKENSEGLYGMARSVKGES